MPKKDKITKLQEDVKEEAGGEVRASEEPVKSEIISAKKVAYAELDDEVTTIFDKVKAISAKHIYIVVPKRAVLFQSLVNLRILRRKAEDVDKKIYLITNDSNGIHLAHKVGIDVYNKADSSGKPALFSTELNDERLRITPLKASVNAVEEEAPTRMTERKISISEILRKKNRGVTKVTPIDSNKDKKKKKQRFVIVAPNRHALIAFVAVTLVILLVIVYIALPGVTIYLTPSASVLEKSVNITLADFQTNKAELDTHPTHMLASYPISTTVSKTMTHYTTGKKFSENAANAGGNLTIINTTRNVWPLVANTRFQTAEGIVFRIKAPATVPAATSAGPAKLQVFVSADEVDAYGVIVGERGNIDPTRFSLPGLRESSQSQLYAESYEPMTGGVTDFITYVSNEDLEAAKARLSDELIKAAVDELRLAVAEKGELTGGEVTYKLLEGDQAVKIGETAVELDAGLGGQEIGEFEVGGSVDVSGVYYDHADMLEILKSELLLKKSPQKELLKINEASTTYRIFEWDEARGKIKLTANIKGIEQFEIDPGKENGMHLLEKIKEHVVGQDIEQAKLYIQNLPQINKVEIDSWPAWSPTIPNITDNIDFEIRNAVMVD